MHETETGRGHTLLLKRNLPRGTARSLIGSMICNLLSIALQGARSWACDIPFLRGFQLRLPLQERIDDSDKRFEHSPLKKRKGWGRRANWDCRHVSVHVIHTNVCRVATEYRRVEYLRIKQKPKRQRQQAI